MYMHSPYALMYQRNIAVHVAQAVARPLTVQHVIATGLGSILGRGK